MKPADQNPDASGLPEELRALLEEIEGEPVPEKLLDLAIRLQEKLRDRRDVSSPEPAA